MGFKGVLHGRKRDFGSRALEMAGVRKPGLVGRFSKKIFMGGGAGCRYAAPVRSLRLLCEALHGSRVCHRPAHCGRLRRFQGWPVPFHAGIAQDEFGQPQGVGSVTVSRQR